MPDLTALSIHLTLRAVSGLGDFHFRCFNVTNHNLKGPNAAAATIFLETFTWLNNAGERLFKPNLSTSVLSRSESASLFSVYLGLKYKTNSRMS